MSRKIQIAEYGDVEVVDTDLWEEPEFNTFWTRLGRFIASGKIISWRDLNTDTGTREFKLIKVNGDFSIQNLGDRIFLFHSGNVYLTFRSKDPEGVVNGFLPAGIPVIVTQSIDCLGVPYSETDLDGEIIDFIEDYLS